MNTETKLLPYRQCGYCSISFKSTVTHPAPLSIAKFGRGHAGDFRISLRHTALKIGCKVKKSPNFRSDVENFAGVTPKFGQMSKWFFESRVTPGVDLNEILQYGGDSYGDLSDLSISRALLSMSRES
jgi:hypothetical protein